MGSKKIEQSLGSFFFEQSSWAHLDTAVYCHGQPTVPFARCPGNLYSLRFDLEVVLAFIDIHILLCIYKYHISNCIAKAMYIEKPK